ncbi:MAG: hypothetical protein KAR22_09010, partial [Gammaproteobacteria bacterium]|nr:hypothetical protein [Gammaproteobacteria bacterium]
MNALNDLRDCLASSEPKLLDIPPEFPMPPDPVAWAHRVCSVHPADVQAQAMPRTVGVEAQDPGRALTLASDATPELVRNVLTGISKGAAAHASMEMWHADSCGERIADPAARPFKDFIAETLEPWLRKLNPVGFYTKLTLWFSADEHLYDAHCDMADGMLFQLQGEKIVEIWPVPEERGKTLLFDHAYGTSRMTAPGQRFAVSAGQALFIPAGAMHEVVVASDQVSVSMSLHMGSPFPVMELCRDLNMMSGPGCVLGLPDEMMHRDKFRVFYFEPALYRDAQQAQMPGPLRDALLNAVIRPQGYSRESLGELLDAWWRAALA